MSDLAVFAVGVGFGLLLLIPVIYVLRHEIAENAQRMFRRPSEEQDHQGDGSGDMKAIPGVSPQGGLSPLGAMFCIASAACTTVWGLVSGGAIFIFSGGFLGIAVLVALLTDRERKRRAHGD